MCQAGRGKPSLQLNLGPKLCLYASALWHLQSGLVDLGCLSDHDRCVGVLDW
jgi:hypothetical protein